MKPYFLLVLLLALFTSFSLPAKTYEVGILIDFVSDDFRPEFDRLEKEVKAVVGAVDEIVFDEAKILSNNFDADVAKQQYQSLLNDGTDIILAFGPINSELIEQQTSHPKPTILFGAINTDVVNIDPKKVTSGIDNFTYIAVPWSYRKDLSDFKTIYGFKKVGVIGSFGPWDTPATRAEFDKIFDYLGADYKIINYQSLSQFEESLSDVDAVYMAEGFGIPKSEMQALANLLIERKLPAFTSSNIEDVVDGWLATNQTDTTFERIFRRIALSIEAVVDGANLADRPVLMEFADSLTVNYNTAEKIGVPIRFSQIATLNLVGNFDDTVSDQTYTVLEAVNIALEKNLGLRTDSLDVALAEENLAAAKTTYYPDLTLNGTGLYLDPDLARLSGGSNPEQTLSGAATLSQTLYSEDGSAAISSQKSLLKAQKENYKAAVLNTVLATTQASFALLRQKNALRSQAENLEITQRNLQVAEQNYEAGQASKADIFRFQSELATNMQSVVDAINGYRQGQHALNSVLNNPIGLRVEIEDVELENSPFEPDGFGYQQLSAVLDDPAEQLVFQEFLIEQGLAVSPELAALGFNLKAIERDIAQYGWRRYIPTVSASAQYNRVFDRSGVGIPDPNLTLDSDYNVGLVFSIPIFNQNLDNVSHRQAKRQKEQLLLQIATQEQLIETNIRDAVLDLSGRIANIELSAVSEQAALQSLALVEASYASGAATVTDLIDSQNNYLQTQLASSNALYNFIDSALSMERAVGIFLFIDNPKMNTLNFAQRYAEYRNKTNAAEKTQ